MPPTPAVPITARDVLFSPDKTPELEQRSIFETFRNMMGTITGGGGGGGGKKQEPADLVKLKKA
jgi:hypothetical protein